MIKIQIKLQKQGLLNLIMNNRIDSAGVHTICHPNFYNKYMCSYICGGKLRV